MFKSSIFQFENQVNNISSCVPGGEPGNTGGAPAGRGAHGGAPAGRSPVGEDSGLGTHYQIDFHIAQRVVRFALLDEIGRILPEERVAWCVKRVLPRKEFVAITKSESSGRAHYRNVMRCCRIWVCPLCAPKALLERLKELEKGFGGYKARGGAVYMATFTLQHNLGDALVKTGSNLLEAIAKTFSGRGWNSIKQKYGIEGLVSAPEIRWGPKNGWHPHKHIDILCKKPLTGFARAFLEDEIKKRYCAVLARVGGYALPNIGFELTEDTTDGKYLVKWGIGDELIRGGEKDARGTSESMTPFGLIQWLMSGAEGSQKAAQLFKEYFRFTKGLRQLVFHKGTRKLLQLSAVEMTDQAILKKEDEDEILLYQVALDVWERVCKRRLRARLLEVAEKSGVEGVEGFLRGLF